MWNNYYNDEAIQATVKTTLREVLGSSLHMQLQKAAQVNEKIL